MEIKRNGSRPSTKGSADYFTGTVRVDPLFGPPEPARAGGSSVTFEPGARTAWHAHPLGQTLIVTAGCGRVQARGRAGRGDPAGRCGVDPARSEALARGRADHRDDAHRHPGKARRPGRRVDGKGHRRTIRALTPFRLVPRWKRHAETQTVEGTTRPRSLLPRGTVIDKITRMLYTQSHEGIPLRSERCRSVHRIGRRNLIST